MSDDYTWEEKQQLTAREMVTYWQERARDAEMACKMANARIEELEGDVEELKNFQSWAVKQIQGWQDSYDGTHDDEDMILKSYEERCQDCEEKHGNYMTPNSSGGYYRRCFKCENKAK